MAEYHMTRAQVLAEFSFQEASYFVARAHDRKALSHKALAWDVAAIFSGSGQSQDDHAASSGPGNPDGKRIVPAPYLEALNREGAIGIGRKPDGVEEPPYVGDAISKWKTKMADQGGVQQ